MALSRENWWKTIENSTIRLHQFIILFPPPLASSMSLSTKKIMIFLFMSVFQLQRIHHSGEFRLSCDEFRLAKQAKSG